MENTLMELVETAQTFDYRYNKTDENVDRAAELESLGFLKLSQDIIKKVSEKDKLARIAEFKYLVILPEKIQAFLEKKASLYNKTHKEEPTERESLLNQDFFTTALNSYAFGSLVPPGRTYQQDIYAQLLSTMDTPLMKTWGVEKTKERYISKYPTETFSARTCDYLNYQDGLVGQYVWNEIPIDSYETLPPQHVLDVLKTHTARNLFDYFTIASVKGIKDPLLFGRILDKPERYFIAQWGEDIALEDVL